MAEYSPIKKSHGFYVGKDYDFRLSTGSDFSGFSLRWTLWKRPRREGDTPIIDKSGGDIEINSSSLVTVHIPAADTEGEKAAASDWPNYWHELTRTDDGSKQVLSEGDVVLRQSFT